MFKDSSTKYYQNKKNTIKYYKMRKTDLLYLCKTII